MLRIIREEESPKPSTRLSSSESLPSIAAQRQLEPKQLALLVSGDEHAEHRIGGTTRGSQYDAIIASGLLSLGGTLNVSIISGFTPAAGERFDILDWGTLTGMFSAV